MTNKSNAAKLCSAVDLVYLFLVPPLFITPKKPIWQHFLSKKKNKKIKINKTTKNICKLFLYLYCIINLIDHFKGISSLQFERGKKKKEKKLWST